MTREPFVNVDHAHNLPRVFHANADGDYTLCYGTYDEMVAAARKLNALANDWRKRRCGAFSHVADDQYGVMVGDFLVKVLNYPICAREYSEIVNDLVRKWADKGGT